MKVGDTIYLKPLRTRNKGIQDTIIVSIGRKWINTDWAGRFEISTMLQDGKGYSPSHKAYLTREEIELEYERDDLFDKIRDYFQYPSNYGTALTLEQLRQISQIVNYK